MTMKIQNSTLIKTKEGYLWAEMDRHYKTLQGAKFGITHDSKQLARRGIRTYIFLTIIDKI